LRRLTLALSLVLIALAVAPLAGARPTDAKLTLVAYSTPREAYAKIIPAFAKTPKGAGVSFDQSYGASGDQARAVLAGLQADVVGFSLEPDMTQLVDKGLVDKSWNTGFYKGMVTNSVVVFVVRNGNPKKIKTWNDLVKPGVDVITPNPFTSGGARWNVMAAYGAQRKLGKTHKQAVAYLENLFRHVSVQDKSARESLQTFLAGKGDVLLAYENEALLALKNNQPAYFVIPRSTILIENPVAVVKGTEHAAEANAFVSYLRTPPAQRIFADAGYRPIVKSVAKEYTKKFPHRPGQFTIRDLGLGGWAKVQKQFFDVNKGIMADIERRVGGVTG
jgi:sulfate/thiosulfate-binding protein